MGSDKSKCLRGKGQGGPSLREVTCHSLEVEKRFLSTEPSEEREGRPQMNGMCRQQGGTSRGRNHGSSQESQVG